METLSSSPPSSSISPPSSFKPQSKMTKPPPPQTPSSPQTQTPTNQAKTQLKSLTALLHLTHHRNKNQHRLSKWYKHLSILRRNINKLLSEVEVLETAEKFSTGGGKGEVYVREARERVERRVEFLEAWVLGRAFVAFSTVVQDLQYSNLGLMLLGVLARIRTVIRPLGKGKVEDQEDEDWGGEMDGGDDEDVAREEKSMQDFGEVVKREELDVEDETRVELKTPKAKRAGAEDAHTPERDPDLQSNKRKEEKKKKKRKRGDAFDDLFDSLIWTASS